jgi:hypothetical protein
MRSYIIMAVIMVLLAGGSIWGNRYINTSTQKLVQSIEQIDERLDKQDWVQADSQLQVLKKDWDQTKDVWSVLVHHQEIDTIDISVMRLTEYVQANNSVLATGELAALRLLFEHISDTEALNLKNIF